MNFFFGRNNPAVSFRFSTAFLIGITISIPHHIILSILMPIGLFICRTKRPALFVIAVFGCAIQAIIHKTQALVNGSTVKLRLMNDIFINGVLIPKDNFVFGTADLNGERLGIKINSIGYRNSLFPVELSVCDMDGIEGVYIPGAITRDVAKGSADRAVQGIGFTALDPSLGAQAASAGIETAKTLLSKKAKLIKVTVKAGYQVKKF